MGKVRTFLMLIFFLNSFLLFGQKLFIEGFATYQFKLGGTIETNNFVIDDSTYSNATNVNIGSGFGAGLTIGREIKNNLICETRIYYIYGIPNEYEYSFTFVGLGAKTNTEINLFSIRVEPSIRMFLWQKKLNMSVAVGPSFSFFNRMIKKETTDAFYSFYSYNLIDSEEKFSGGFGVGGCGTFKLSHCLWKRWELFSELNFNALFWSPKKSVYTKYYANGDNLLETMTINEKETEYVSELHQGNSPVDENQPSKEIKSNYTMSTYGIKLGIKFKIISKSSNNVAPASL